MISIGNMMSFSISSVRVVVAVLDAFHFDLSMITDADIERGLLFD